MKVIYYERFPKKAIRREDNWDQEKREAKQGSHIRKVPWMPLVQCLRGLWRQWWFLAIQSVLHGPEVPTSPDSLLEVQNLRPHTSRTERESALLTRSLKWFLSILKFERNWYRSYIKTVPIRRKDGEIFISHCCISFGVRAAPRLLNSLKKIPSYFPLCVCRQRSFSTQGLLQTGIQVPDTPKYWLRVKIQ